MSETHDPGRTGGLGDSLRGFGDSLLGLFQTRIEILALEWAEERGKLMRLLLGVTVILACLFLAIVIGLVYLLLLVGEEHRVTVLGVAALVLLFVAGGGVLVIRSWFKRSRPMFGTTISELRKDREWIRGRS
jgi:uncharacterized membrane protein YqjE